MDFSEKIKELRIRKGLTLEQVGEKVGVGKSTVRKWENGLIANMKRDKIAKLADALGVSPSYLMGWESKDDHEQALLLYQKYLQAPEQARQTIDYILKLQQPDSEHQ